MTQTVMSYFRFCWKCIFLSGLKWLICQNKIIIFLHLSNHDFPPPISHANDWFASCKVDLFEIWLKIKLSLFWSKTHTKVTTHRVCTVYKTFLMCECNTELPPTGKQSAVYKHNCFKVDLFNIFTLKCLIELVQKIQIFIKITTTTTKQLFTRHF